MAELWLLTDQGMIGLIDSTATAANQSRELCQQFRFIIPGATGEAEKQPDGTWKCGYLRLRVWETDLPHSIVERMRRYCMADHDRRDWQLTLSDTDRSPEQLAQDPLAPGQAKLELKLPDLHDYAPGYHRYSLVEVSPLPGLGFSEAKRVEAKGTVGFQARLSAKTYRVTLDVRSGVTSLHAN
jgi:hypothetical protein